MVIKDLGASVRTEYVCEGLENIASLYTVGLLANLLVFVVCSSVGQLRNHMATFMATSQYKQAQEG